jgi:hypothetical protein
MYATRQPAPTPVIITAPCKDNDIIRNVRYAHTLDVGDVVALMTHTDPYGFWLARVTTTFYRRGGQGVIDIQWYDRFRLQLFKPLDTIQAISVDCLVVVPLKIRLTTTPRAGVLHLESARMILEAGERRHAELHAEVQDLNPTL